MGYGYASVCLIEALQRQQVRVDFMNETAPAHISFIQPPWYQTPHKKQYSVGYTPWESSVLPEGWKGPMDEQDEIWTPSKYCQEVFANYDIEAKVVPHGIDPEIYSINERILNKPFVFYHAGSPTERKGSQLVVDAFIDLFEGNSDVILLLKSSGPTNARWRDKKGHYHGNAAKHPQIQVVEFGVEVEDMARLYHRAHCFVYPSNGEGFGLIPFQAIATGMPTILTDATALSDFAHLGIPLKSTPEEGYGIHKGMWAAPDKDHLRELMLKVYENWEEENKKAVQNARILHATQTWDHVAKQVVDILGDHLEPK
jgi:glycosyltransferase involved in cell wall biosynthesis